MEGMIFVSAYVITREYGGPEEGGWWWNRWALIQTIPCERKDAPAIRSHLMDKYGDMKEGDIYSVLGGQEIETAVEEEAGENETKERPHYE